MCATSTGKKSRHSGKRRPLKSSRKTSSDAPGFSTAYAKACKDCGVECELHIFSDRNRCAAPAIYQEKSELGDVYGENTQLWGTLALNWLNYIFSIPKANNDKV